MSLEDEGMRGRSAGGLVRSYPAYGDKPDATFGDACCGSPQCQHARDELVGGGGDEAESVSFGGGAAISGALRSSRHCRHMRLRPNGS